MSEPVIAVVGAGAVGGLLAALLHRAGIGVVAVARPETARSIAADGITIRSRQYGDWVARVEAVTEIPAGASVILATKAFALPGLATSLTISRPAEVVSLLNGLEHLALIRGAAPGALVAGGSVAVESTRLHPTVIDHRSPFLRLRVPAHAADSRIVSAWREAALDVTAGGTDEDVLWAKFRFLAPMALLTSYWRLPIGAAVQRNPQLTAALLAEVAQIATRDGMPTDAGQLGDALASLPPAMLSSLQNDLAAGGQTELDAIGGALARRGRILGAATDTVDAIVGQLSAGTSLG